MTQVIIKTETAEEMRKVLAMARKSNVNFEAIAIKKKPAASNKVEQPAIGKAKDNDLSEDAFMLAAIAEGSNSEIVDTKKFLNDLAARCK